MSTKARVSEDPGPSIVTSPRPPGRKAQAGPANAIDPQAVGHAADLLPGLRDLAGFYASHSAGFIPATWAACSTERPLLLSDVTKKVAEQVAPDLAAVERGRRDREDERIISLIYSLLLMKTGPSREGLPGFNYILSIYSQELPSKAPADPAWCWPATSLCQYSKDPVFNASDWWPTDRSSSTAITLFFR